MGRRYTIACADCGSELTSELSGRSYFLLLVYAHIVFAVVAVPLVLGLAGGHWLIAAASLLVFLLAVMPVAMLLHARNLRVRDVGLAPSR